MKPSIDQLLVDAALKPDVCRRLVESPDEVFKNYNLTVEQKELLRRPDHCLLPLLGAAFQRQMKSPPPGHGPAEVSTPAAESLETGAPPQSSAQPIETLVALTVVPCVLRENGQFKGITYVLWANPFAAGTDPASLPAPDGTTFPGEPLSPLRAVIRITAWPSPAGNAQLNISGSFEQTSMPAIPPPPESAGDPAAPPFNTSLDSPAVQNAVAAVRQASVEEKYNRLLELLRALRQGDVR